MRSPLPRARSPGRGAQPRRLLHPPADENLRGAPGPRLAAGGELLRPRASGRREDSLEKSVHPGGGPSYRLPAAGVRVAQPGPQRGKLMPGALTFPGWRGPAAAHALPAWWGPPPAWEPPRMDGRLPARPPGSRHPGRAPPAPAPPPRTPAPAARCARSHGSTSFPRSKSVTRRRAMAGTRPPGSSGAPHRGHSRPRVRHRVPLPLRPPLLPLPAPLAGSFRFCLVPAEKPQHRLLPAHAEHPSCERDTQGRGKGDRAPGPGPPAGTSRCTLRATHRKG